MPPPPPVSAYCRLFGHHIDKSFYLRRVLLPGFPNQIPIFPFQIGLSALCLLDPDGVPPVCPGFFLILFPVRTAGTQSPSCRWGFVPQTTAAHAAIGDTVIFHSLLLLLLKPSFFFHNTPIRVPFTPRNNLMKLLFSPPVFFSASWLIFPHNSCYDL